MANEKERGMRTPQFPAAVTGVLVALRILVGWHFLYEGLAKLLNPRWSSAGYLAESTWFLSGFFHAIVANPTWLKVTDLLNAWGLTLIGLALFLGAFTRLASLGGVFLLALYYVAQPPLMGFESPFAEGSYLFVNKNLIELAVLLLFVVLPRAALPGLDSILGAFNGRRRETPVPEPVLAKEDNHSDVSFSGLLRRRELIASLAAVPFLGAFAVSVLMKKSYEERQLATMQGTDSVSSASQRAIRFANLADLKGQVPKGRIGHVNLGRIIVGGNLVSGFAHSRDLIYVSPLLRTYFTDEKVIETLRLCEACGIDTAILRTDDNTLRILDKYRKRGGKIQWLAQVYPKAEDMTTNIQKAIDHGAMGAFVMGGIADQWVRDNQFELLASSLEFIKKNGLIAGTAAHSVRVPISCEDAGLDVDFYMKTLHRDDYWSAHPRVNRPEFSTIGQNQPSHDQFHDNLWCIDPEETVGLMERISKPWIAYKVLAAGAIHPKDGFRYVFEKGADFACVGMFDFQVIENANTALEILSGDLQRSRIWQA